MSAFFIFHFSLFTLNAQGIWSPRAPLPIDSTMFQGIPGFSIGNYGYAGLGDWSGAEPSFNDLWQFNASNNTWTKKAPFPGKARVAPGCFVICDNAYIVCGSVSNGGACVTECWQFNATHDIWTQKANYPGTPCTYLTGFTIDSLGYAGFGGDDDRFFKNNVYCYHPSTNTWTEIALFPGTERYSAEGFGINHKGYVGLGMDSLFNGLRDLWEYNPDSNIWTQLQDIPNSEYNVSNGFSICYNLYVAAGADNNAFNEFDSRVWRFNTLTNNWTEETSFPGIKTTQGASFAINDTGYYGFGADSTGNVINTFYKFFVGDNCNMIYDSCGYILGEKTIQSSVSSSINVYPNPFKDECFIELNGFNNSLFKLYTLEGEKINIGILPYNNDNKYILKRNGIREGVFILSIQNGNEIFYKKLVIID